MRSRTLRACRRKSRSGIKDLGGEIKLFQQLTPSIWTVQKPFEILRQDIGARMTVIKLRNGDLWLHSVVKLQDSEHRALAALGPVTHIVAPNLMHHLSLADFVRRYPLARFYGARNLERKRRHIPFSETLSSTPPPSWRGQIEVLELEGIPSVNEVVFFHPESRTLVLADLAFNLQKFKGVLGIVIAKYNRCYKTFGPTRLLRSMIQDKAKFAASIRQLMLWDFDRVIVSHGEIVEKDGKQLMQRAYAWLTE